MLYEVMLGLARWCVQHVWKLMVGIWKHVEE